MTTVVLVDWNATTMPGATYTGATAGPGGDTIALIATAYAPGALQERETIAFDGVSVVNGPKDVITPAVLGLNELPGRLYPRSRRM